MHTNRKAVLMISLGTPDSPGWFDVASYLREFLGDGRIINIPSLLRYMLVNLIIVPTRTFSSSKSYKELWTDRGSPLKYHMEDLTAKVQEDLKGTHDVFYAMRYKNPSVKNLLKELESKGYDEIILFPVFPQYSSAANGSFLEHSLKQIANWVVIPSIKTVDQFYDNDDFLSAFSENIQKFDLDAYDKIIFSYHGLPMSQLDEVYENGKCDDRECEDGVHGDNHHCYRAACYETTKLLVSRIGIDKSKTITSFQSRLDSKWVKPFSDKVLKQFAEEGVKNVLVVSPSFTGDCLETIIEIGDEYKELFLEKGGQKLDYVPSLNSNDSWVKCIVNIIRGI
jgi:ferrochelatase|tara:strand:+ start:12627 stop:13640 length:1014 start_codon:yes stop_codon:yes gene_type:complete